MAISSAASPTSNVIVATIICTLATSIVGGLFFILRVIKARKVNALQTKQ